MKKPPEVTMIVRLSIFAILGILVLCAGCSRMPDRASLIVLPGTDAVRFTRRAGSEEVEYQLNGRYPAKAAVKEISSQLAKQGWKPLKGDFLNPGGAVLTYDGLVTFGDVTRQQAKDVIHSLADWTNPDGDVIRYTLSTSSNEPTAANKLSVHGTYIPAAQVTALRAELHSTEKNTPGLIRPEGNTK